MRFRPSWTLVLLGLVAAGAVVAAVLELGPPTSTARTAREVVTATRGVVQSTVTGSGNVEPGTDVQASFQTSGTLQHLYVSTGDHVVKGQLIATLDPTAAQSTLDQAQENLTAAEDQLENAEEETVTQTTSAPVTSATEEVAFHPATSTTTTTSTTAAATTPTTTSTAPPRTTTTATAPTTTTTTGRSSAPSSGAPSSGGTSAAQSSGVTAATKAANIASAQASVDGAEASVTNAETALHETHLYAPATGTVVSVASVSAGDEVSGSSGSAASSSGASSSGAGTGTATTSAGGLGSSGNSSSSSSSSSTGLVEIVNTAKMTMTVAFSESDISKIKAGQPATVTLDALTGVKLGAHVTSISTLGTTSSSVVSYDAVLTLDQHDARVKPGMSASAEVITGQASGVTLPTSAVSTRGATATVELLRNGTTRSTPVSVGVQGDSRTQIVSGLRAGDQVVVTQTLPALGSSSSSGSSGASGTLGGTASRLGGFPGAAGGGFPAGAGAGGGFTRRFGGG